MKWVVYVLKCPRTNAIRYVGWTSRPPEKRLAAHIKESIASPDNHRRKWILSLLSIGMKPLIEVIEAGCGSGWGQAERRWIAFYRAEGTKLVNGTDGGDGSPGGWGTFEQRSESGKKMMAKRTPEQRNALNAGLTAEQRSALAKSHWVARSPEQRSAAAQKRLAKMTPEKLKLGYQAAFGKRTPEQRTAAARHAISVLNARMTPEQRSERTRAAVKKRTPEQWKAIAKKRQTTIAARRQAALLNL
jgi:GIY-YIG catalytic domain-containing protein